MITPHRKNGKKPKAQYGRTLGRYERRWKVDRLFAWLGIFWRFLVSCEQRPENFLGLVAGLHSCPAQVFVRWLLIYRLSRQQAKEVVRRVVQCMEEAVLARVARTQQRAEAGSTPPFEPLQLASPFPRLLYPSGAGEDRDGC